MFGNVPLDCRYFNPRSSCEERRKGVHKCRCHRYFNPRSSCEERLLRADTHIQGYGDFNPRSSCEERHTLADMLDSIGYISIHAPHARSDIITQA